MKLLFLIEPIGFDPSLTRRVMKCIGETYGVLPLPGFTDSQTLETVGICRLSETDDFDYDYTSYFDPKAIRIDYKNEPFEMYDEVKHIWPFINEGANTVVTSGTLDIYCQYLKSLDDIDIIPIVLAQEYDLCVDRLFDYYAHTPVRPSKIIRMLEEVDYHYASIFEDTQLTAVITYNDVDDGIMHILDILSNMEDSSKYGCIVNDAIAVNQRLDELFLKEGKEND